MTAGPFAVLEADPPWLFGDALPGNGRGASKHYPCLSLEELKGFPIPALAPAAVLLLWRVAAMQREALELAAAWGFEVKSEIVWDKTTNAAGALAEVLRARELLEANGLGHLDVAGRAHFGMGHYVRGSHEVCLLATRGGWRPRSRSIRSRFAAPVGRHSEKPEAFYRLVEELAEGPYVRLFARGHRPGWVSMGNEIQGAA